MTSTELLYHTYNSLFLRLPFSKIAETGTHLAIFAQACEDGFKEGKSPADIIHAFWDEYAENKDADTRNKQLFYFIQYIERQVVLFDSVEDALFEQTHDLSGPGSLDFFLNRVNTPALRARLVEKLRDYAVRLVLTAHPTQFYPGKVLGIINDLGNDIKGNNLQAIHQLLMQLGMTPFVNRQRPTPYDEALSLGWYLEYVFYNALPDILYRLLKSLGQDVTTCEHPQALALGFWPGGDRDGNPFVTAQLTRDVATRLRESIIRCYHRDVKALRRRLTFRGIDEKMSAIERRLHASLFLPAGNPARYRTAQELLDELLQARLELADDNKDFFRDLLDRFILKVRIFGFYFASLDIRQDSRKHGEVWDAVFSQFGGTYMASTPEARLEMLQNAQFHLDEHAFPEDSLPYETIASVRQIVEIQRENGQLGCHRYIISNCQSALNVLEVFTLARLAIGNIGPGGSIPLDIVPLFETVDDLAAAGPIMRQLYTHPAYSRHLAARGGCQHIMLGFSDGTKDGGYLRANWSIYRAKAALSQLSREYGIAVLFFDGRGGPPGRGGGNNASYYAAHGADIENREIQVTIQGQTVSSTYGTHQAACYNIERLFTAGLENHLFQTHAQELSESDHTLMDELADAAYKAYLELKNHPRFVPYLEHITPLKWYGDTNIASRPTKRNAAEGLRFEDLRAIPFVGAWAQMKQNVPGYYGFGGALAALNAAGKGEQLRELYKRSLFFRTLVENSMQALSKSNLSVTQHIGKDADFGPFWDMLNDEYNRTGQELLELSGQGALLSGNQQSQQSIRLREEIVLPLIAIQQYALQMLRAEGAHLTKAQSDMYRNLVLRAMFGIINAARNAA
jgi:phosphoenolpyruvate carboxylase